MENRLRLPAQNTEKRLSYRYFNDSSPGKPEQVAATMPCSSLVWQLLLPQSVGLVAVEEEVEEEDEEDEEQKQQQQLLPWRLINITYKDAFSCSRL